MPEWISRQLAPLTLSGALFAYLLPEPVLALGSLYLWLFAATMFALGLVLEPRDLGDTLRHPGRIAYGVGVQYLVMPLLGYLVARFAGLPAAVALGFVIVAAAPGAMASGVIVYLAGGALAYSVSLTTVATLLSPLLTPALVQWLGGSLLPVPFWPMLLTILWTVVLPLLGGMALRRLAGPRLAGVRRLAPAIAALSIVLICAVAVARNRDLIGDVGPLVALWVVLLNLAGYVAGWLAARLAGLDLAHRLTLAIEIGMQNAGLGVALALHHFEPATALPGALFAVWCILTAALASRALRGRLARNQALEAGARSA